MIKELDIQNAHLDINFNEYIYEYTVSALDNINYLDFVYTTNAGVNVNIENNNLIDNNIVTFCVYNDSDIKTYKFYVNKENTSIVSEIDNFKNTLDIPSETLPIIKIQILSISIFLLILIIFSILFPSKRNKTLFRK